MKFLVIRFRTALVNHPVQTVMETISNLLNVTALNLPDFPLSVVGGVCVLVAGEVSVSVAGVVCAVGVVCATEVTVEDTTRKE